MPNYHKQEYVSYVLLVSMVYNCFDGADKSDNGVGMSGVCCCGLDVADTVVNTGVDVGDKDNRWNG